MDIKDLNKAQLLLLALLVSFITSVATGITVVALMDQAPKSVSTPINRIVKQTVERIVPVEQPSQSLTDEEKKLLEELKSVHNLSASLYLRGEEGDTLLASGLMLGEGKVIISAVINPPQIGEVYVVKSITGEKNVSKVTTGPDYTLVEIGKEIKDTNNQTNQPEPNAPTQ